MKKTIPTKYSIVSAEANNMKRYIFRENDKAKIEGTINSPFTKNHTKKIKLKRRDENFE